MTGSSSISIANPAPLGLFAFGMTTNMLMFVEMGWVEHEFEQQVCATAAFLGGVAQLLVGIFELLKGSSFSVAVFGCYGTFWMSWAMLYVLQHSETSDFEPNSSFTKGRVAFMIQWGLLTAGFWCFTLRRNMCLIILFALLDVTFFLLAIAIGTGSKDWVKVAGYFGFMTALMAFYTAFAELANEELGRHVLPGLKPMLKAKVVLDTDSVTRLISYDAKSNTLFLAFRGLQIQSSSDVAAVVGAVAAKIKQVRGDNGKCHVVVDYQNVAVASSILTEYLAEVQKLQSERYLSVKRFSFDSFGGEARSGQAPPLPGMATLETPAPKPDTAARAEPMVEVERA